MRSAILPGRSTLVGPGPLTRNDLGPVRLCGYGKLAGQDIFDADLSRRLTVSYVLHDSWDFPCPRACNSAWGRERLRTSRGCAWVASRCSALPRFAVPTTKIIRNISYFERLMRLLICGFSARFRGGSLFSTQTTQRIFDRQCDQPASESAFPTAIIAKSAAENLAMPPRTDTTLTIISPPASRSPFASWRDRDAPPGR